MVTIEQLTVTVSVEGNGDADEVAFVRMFNRYIDRWHRELRFRAAQDERAAADRSLDGGRYRGELV